MALKIEGVVDRGMHAEEALGRSSRFEPLHLALSSPYRLMRILGAIVFAEPLFMRGRSAVTARTPSRRSGASRLPADQRRRSDQLDDIALRRGVALNIPLRCRERGVAGEFLNVAERTAGFDDLFRRTGNKGSAPGM